MIALAVAMGLVVVLLRPDGESAVEKATRGGYSALGDSYSSGEGVWDAGADRATTAQGGAEECHRSEGAYGRAVARAFRFKKGSALWACSGARTWHMWREGQHEEPPQLSRVNADTSLITLSIGGNDVGFSEIFGTCIIKPPDSTACRDQDAKVRTRLGELRAGLKSVFDRIAERAPGARVIVLGYPRPFPARPVRRVDNLSLEDQRWVNGIARDLDGVIANAVREAERRLDGSGARGEIEYLDVYDAYTGHELTTPQPYVERLAIDLSELGRSIQRSYHPNAGGNQRLADLVIQRIKDGPPN